MIPKDADAIEPRLVAYLLGRLSPPEQAELEEEYFVDDGLHEQLKATADDLVHAYLSGVLSREDRERFETYFLASEEQQHRFEFIRGLRDHVGSPDTRPLVSRAPGRRRISMWAAAAAVLLVFAVSALLWRWPERGAETARGPEPTPSPDVERTLALKATPRLAEPPALVRLERTASGSMDVALPARADTVRFEVAVDGVQPSYEAILRTFAGREVWRRKLLMPERTGAPLRFRVPAALLAAGEYVLSIRGEVLRGSEPKAASQQYRLRFQHNR